METEKKKGETDSAAAEQASDAVSIERHRPLLYASGALAILATVMFALGSAELLWLLTGHCFACGAMTDVPKPAYLTALPTSPLFLILLVASLVAFLLARARASEEVRPHWGWVPAGFVLIILLSSVIPVIPGETRAKIQAFDQKHKVCVDNFNRHQHGPVHP